MRCVRALLRWTFRFLGAVALIVTAGVVYEAIAAAHDDHRYPPPGRLIDVGGYRLHLKCAGQGGPAVVLESGSGVSSNGWALVQPELSKVTTVCSYDRAGYGWSDFGPLPRTMDRIAAELHRLLHNGEIRGPYVLVGHSFGGEIVRVYAGQYPTEVAGLVVIASAPDDWRTRMPRSFVKRADKSAGAQRREFDLLPMAARIGLLRFLGFQSYFSYLRAHMPPEIAAAEISFLRRGKPFQAVRAEEIVQDDQLPVWSFVDQPLIVLDDKWQLPERPTADDLEAERVWRELEANVARHSVRGKLTVTEQSGHMMPLEQPETVIGVVHDVIQQLRQEHRSGSP